MLNFEPVTLNKKDMIERYFYVCGENSCQHSFAASFCLAGKYGDQICERDGVLYILRSRLCSDSERVYLFPLTLPALCATSPMRGGKGDSRIKIKTAINEILNDAHEHGARVRFETLTRRAKDLTLNLFPDLFAVADDSENRKYFEYVYSIDKLLNMPGHELASRRKKIHHFFNEYGDRFKIERINETHIAQIRAFQAQWLASRTKDSHNITLASQLAQEDAGIQIALDNFFELGLSGVAAFLDGNLCGYEYGAALSRDCCDAMVQKGDRSIPEIYRVLEHEFLRLCFPDYKWVNWEEDLGVESLRTMKMLYEPEFMIEKFIVFEKF